MATVRVEVAEGAADYPGAVYEESPSGYLRVLAADDGRLLAAYAAGAGRPSYLPEPRRRPSPPAAAAGP